MMPAYMNMIAGALLRLMALLFNRKPSLKKYLKNTDGWINFSVGFQTSDHGVEQAITFHDGRVSVMSSIPPDADVVLRFTSEQALKDMLRITPNEMLNLILNNKMILEGNLAYLQLFNFLTSLLLGGFHQRRLDKKHALDVAARKAQYKSIKPQAVTDSKRIDGYLQAQVRDNGVKYIPEPYLSAYSLNDFPRLKTFLDSHFTVMPEICTERPKLLTQWYRENGFESDQQGNPWIPELRQAQAFKFLMENKKPIIACNDIIAGTTTAKEHTGVVIYPDAQGTMIWGELLSMGKRILNPYRISRQEAETLHDIFPFWAKRNFRDRVYKEFNNPLCLQIEQRWVFYFVWKSVGISHTIPDFPRILSQGTNGIRDEIDRWTNLESDPDKLHSLSSMRTCLEGLNIYAENLSKEAAEQARLEKNGTRRQELEKMAYMCSRVPSNPAETLDEAVQSLWITWVAVHMENTNTGLSLGRLDQWLQPFFEKDMAKLALAAERSAYIKHAVELMGCFFMRCTDHLPLVPDLGNYLFGGSSSDQAITLGGVTPEGKDGVNDMTYIILKVTEMLSLRDPNVNARYHSKENSDAYLKRLCEVNAITAATPSMHGDAGVFASLKQHGYSLEDIRDWSSTGCVEPTISGKHMGHTGSILMNMVAALEMALNDGCHPGMHWTPGPRTGHIESFTSFDAFFDAYAVQQRFLIDRACELNNVLADVHSRYRPAPFLSALVQGCIEKGCDITRGGALYNTSGSSNIGLADVTDSLLAVKKLVYDERKVSFTDLKRAIDTNFAHDQAIHAMVRTGVPHFGSGNQEAVEMANRVVRLIHDCYASHTNFRGGKYTSGFWSMSQHVAYGNLSGALPSGRLAGKAFTPGLTPQPSASKNFLDNIRDVAHLDPEGMDNNIAFNVKIVPGAKDTRVKLVEAMQAYVKTFFIQGGMQMQFNVVTPETLKDAMANPENYRNLLVRISGYNAYFVTLNREMQIELIERAEYGLSC